MVLLVTHYPTGHSLASGRAQALSDIRRLEDLAAGVMEWEQNDKQFVKYGHDLEDVGKDLYCTVDQLFYLLRNVAEDIQ